MVLPAKLDGHMDDSSLVPNGQFAFGVKELPLDAIDTDDDLHARDQVDLDTIDTYAEDMRHGVVFPAIDVYEQDTGDDIRYLLVEGRHRLEAAKRIDLKSISARVHQGNRRHALIHAAGANVKNGLRRTNRDKQKAVSMLLSDEELVQLSNQEIARMAGVHRTTVDNIRKSLELSREIRTIGSKIVNRKGTTYRQRPKTTEGIPAPKLEQPVSDGLSTCPPQAENADDLHAGNSQTRPPVASVIDFESEPQQVNETLLEDGLEAQAPNASADPYAEVWDHIGQPASLAPPSDPFPGTQAYQELLSAFHGLLNGFEGDVRRFRSQRSCDVPPIKTILDRLEEELQQARHLLEAYPQSIEQDGYKLGVEEPITLEQTDSFCINSPQNPDEETSIVHSSSALHGSETDTLDFVKSGTERPQYFNDSMQASGDRLDTRQAADFLGLPEKRLRMFRRSGTGPRVFDSRHGGAYYFPHDLEVWKRKNEHRWDSLVSGATPLPDFSE